MTDTMTQTDTTLADELETDLWQAEKIGHATFDKAKIETILSALRHSAGDAGAVEMALEPVMHWYQSDEHPERPLAEIVADVVADLQHDRKIALASRPTEAPPAEGERLERADAVAVARETFRIGYCMGAARSSPMPPKGEEIDAARAKSGAYQTALASLASRPTKAPDADRLARLEAALVWYEEQARNCCKLGTLPEGVAARAALDADRGKRARNALKEPTHATD